MIDILCKLDDDDIKHQNEFLERLEKGEDKVIVIFDIVQQKNYYIARVHIGASDWPGLGETVTGIFHEKGYNIGFIYGVVSTDLKYAFISIKVPFPIDKLNQVRADLVNICDEIKSLTMEVDQIKAKLVTTGIEKLEILEQTKNALREISFPEEFEEISKPGGELEKFIFSRSLAYLKERDAKILAETILVAQRFINKLREIGMGVEVHIKNINTEREELTALTVGGFEKDVSMDSVFEAIRDLFPNFRRKFDKEFITPDGITIIRIEFTVDGRPLTQDEIKLLEQHLKSSLKQPKFRLPVNIKFGGEIFGRALIPKMVDETIQTGIPQVAIVPIEQDKNTVTFRLCIVSKESKFFDMLTSNIAKSDGFLLTTYRYPTKVKDVFVTFLTVRALISFFRNDTELYEKLKELIKSSVGNFRDFDEGLRTLDRKNLELVYEKAREMEIPEEFARTFYFAIDDFIRPTLSSPRIVEELNYVYKAVKEHLENNSKKLFLKEDKNTAVLVLVYEPEERIFDRVFPLLEEFNPLLIRFEIYGLNITVLEINKKDLKNTSLEKLFDTIKREVYHEGNTVRN
ncbi:MAG: hypothetical protein ABIM44_02895 [candidate division WOR-3 bacterium]